MPNYIIIYKRTIMNVVDEYIATFPAEIQPRLEQIRAIIRQVIPEAQECISWQMPTYKLKGNVVHFAGHKHHTGFYPGASGIEMFKDRFTGYKYSKGAVQFPHDRPLPEALIAEIVAFRAQENRQG